MSPIMVQIVAISGNFVANKLNWRRRSSLCSIYRRPTESRGLLWCEFSVSIDTWGQSIVGINALTKFCKYYFNKNRTKPATESASPLKALSVAQHMTDAAFQPIRAIGNNRSVVLASCWNNFVQRSSLKTQNIKIKRKYVGK